MSTTKEIMRNTVAKWLTQRREDIVDGGQLFKVAESGRSYLDAAIIAAVATNLTGNVPTEADFRYLRSLNT